MVKDAENPEDPPLVNKNESVGINTSKVAKFIDDQDIMKPVTHSKFNFSVYKTKGSNNQSQ